MITHIEIDGFKMFSNFHVDLEPLQVIVGPNAAGKSNFFDALLLLAHLADADLRTAFQQLRGDAGELFTVQADGTRGTRMKFAVELLVDPTVADSWGASVELKYTRLRYELGIVRQADNKGLERLYVEHEALALIQRSSDRWARRHNLAEQARLLPRLTGGRAPFISTEVEDDISTVYLHQDGRSGRKGSVAAKMERTVLSGVANTEFPHAFAVRSAMHSWRFLQLNPEALRQPSSRVDSQVLGADGGHLPGMLARLEALDPFLLNDISRDLGNLVPGIVQVEVEADRTRDEYVIWARTQDGPRFSPRELSDGTLRMLALVALKNDPEHSGVLLFEEPENGVHPFRLKNIATVMGQLATDFSDADSASEPLRQLLCNTHSPVFISQPAILEHVLFAFTAQRVDGVSGQAGQRITRMVPVRGSASQPALDLGIAQEEHSYTLEEVKAYLDSADLGEARTLLQTAANGQPSHNGSGV